MSGFVKSYNNIEDVHTTEEEKSTFSYMRQATDHFITALVDEKPRIKTARNLYDGVRDGQEFKYLEETFGIETPMSIKMTPLIKTRIDVLLGLLLDEVFTFKMSVNDNATLTKIEKSKLAEKARRVLEGYDTQLKKNADRADNGDDPKADVVTDEYINSVTSMVDEEFISNFEIAAQSLVKFFKQDRTIDLKQKVKQYFLDLLLTGEAYYRVRINKEGADPVFEVCKPENIFFSKNTNHQFMSSGHKPYVYAVVYRKYMNRSEILSRWGNKMNHEAKDKVFGEISKSGRQITDPRHLGHIYNKDGNNSSYNQHNNDSLDSIPVYEVEFLVNNEIKLEEDVKESFRTTEAIKSSKYFVDSYGKNPGSGSAGDKGYRLDRYQSVRIGDDIYLEMGKSRWTPRSMGDPASTVLSFNGGAYNDRNGVPYSTALALKGLQDSYDIVTFFRDNLIANSGVDGSRVNLAAIPKVLGEDYMERVLKFVSLRKQGIELYDPTEDGAHLFSGYGDFKGSLNGNVVNDLNLVLESIEKQADTTSGINRHMYAAAEARDAVTNVRVGQQQVSLITKDLFEVLGTVRSYMISDLINAGKITYKKGKRGSYVVGHKQVIFDVQPENFCYTDFNIHVIRDGEDAAKVQKVRDLVPELIGMGALSPDVIIKLTLCDSPTEMVRIINNSMAKTKEENDQVGQLSQQVEQLTGQLKEGEKAAEESNRQIKSLTALDKENKKRELDIKEYDAKEKYKLGYKKLSIEEMEAMADIKKDKQIVQLEREQIYAESSTGSSREVRNEF